MAGNTITDEEVRGMLSDDEYTALLSLDRHHRDDEGNLYWLEEELGEGIALLPREMGGAIECDDPMAPEYSDPDQESE